MIQTPCYFVDDDVIRMSPFYETSRKILQKIERGKKRPHETRETMYDSDGQHSYDSDLDEEYENAEEHENFEGASSVDVEVGVAGVEKLFTTAKIFASLDVKESKHLYTKCQHITLVAGETLCRVGDTDRTGLFIVQKGELRVFSKSKEIDVQLNYGIEEGREIEIGKLTFGESVGDFDLIDEQPRQITCRASENGCVVLFLRREDFLQFVASNPTAIQKYIQLVIARLWRVCHFTVRDFLGLPSGYCKAAISKDLNLQDAQYDCLVTSTCGPLSLGCSLESYESTNSPSWFATDWRTNDAPEISQSFQWDTDTEYSDAVTSDNRSRKASYQKQIQSQAGPKLRHSVFQKFKGAFTGAIKHARNSLKDPKGLPMESERDLMAKMSHYSTLDANDVHNLTLYTESAAESTDNSGWSTPMTLGKDILPEKLHQKTAASLYSGWDVISPTEYKRDGLLGSQDDILTYGRFVCLEPKEILHNSDHVSHSLYIVIKGSLVVEKTITKQTQVLSALAVPESIVDAASFLTSTRSALRVYASVEGCELAAIGSQELSNLKKMASSVYNGSCGSGQLEEDTPLEANNLDLERANSQAQEAEFYSKLLRVASKALSPVIYEFYSLGLQRQWFRAGEVLYKQGAEATSIYIVINGRARLLRAVSMDHVVSEEDIGRGESAGTIWAAQGGTHDTTCLAVRDVETVRMTKGAFEILSSSRPKAAARVLQGIAQRLSTAEDSRRKLHHHRIPLSGKGVSARASMGNNSDIATIAVVPAGNISMKQERVAPVIQKFAASLGEALRRQHGTCIIIDFDTIQGIFPQEADRLHEPFYRAKVTALISQAQEDWKFILLLSDGEDSAWSRICADHADCCLLVAEPKYSTADITPEEMNIVWKPLKRIINLMKRQMTVDAVKSVLQQKQWSNLMLEGSKPPTGSKQNKRPIPLRRIELVLIHDNEKQPQNTILWISKRPLLTRHHHVRGSSNEDFERLGRWMAGKAVGLVLSGGGSRGLAHVGVLKALHRAKIPIDVIGGTSQGAFIAGLYAQNLPWRVMLKKVREYSNEMGSVRSLLADLTVPFLSVFSGKRFDSVIKKAYGDGPQRIEDLWLQFYAVTTNLSAGTAMVHLEGTLWKAVRASMTLIGLVPPMIDESGQVLCDGGYSDNIPVEALDNLGVGTSIVVDVEDKTLTSWGQLSSTEGGISGLKLLWDRVCPFQRFRFNIQVPTHAQLVNALTWMAHQTNLSRIANTYNIDLYLRPPVTHFKLADFRFMDLIVEDSALYATNRIQRWKKQKSKNKYTKYQPEERKRRPSQSNPTRSVMCMTQLQARYDSDN